MLEVAPQAGAAPAATSEPRLSARIDVDTRFISSPTPLKLAVMTLGVLCVVVSIIALALLDRMGSRLTHLHLADGLLDELIDELHRV